MATSYTLTSIRSGLMATRPLRPKSCTISAGMPLLVFPLGGGGALDGPDRTLRKRGQAEALRLQAVQLPKYGQFTHARTATIADGLLQHRIRCKNVFRNLKRLSLIADSDIRSAYASLRNTGHGRRALERVATAFLTKHASELEEPVCAILTGQNVTPEDHAELRERLRFKVGRG